jgi:CRP/FNR family nitrogen fixation transcriptional regulator
MGRRDIADYLGLKLETVSRALSVLRDDGILSFIGQTQREILLDDRSRLADWATSAFPYQWHPKAKQAGELTMSCQ